MAENVRRRKSKWDIVAEPHSLTETGQVDTGLVNMHVSVKEHESKSDWKSPQSKWSDLRTDDSTAYKESPKTHQSSKWSELEGENTNVAEDFAGRPQFFEVSEMEVGNVGSENFSWDPMTGNQATAEDGDLSQSPKRRYVVEAGDKDVYRNSQQEPNSGNQTLAEDGSVTDGMGNRSIEKDHMEVDRWERQDTREVLVSRTPEHPDVEAGDNESLKRSEWEHISGNQTTTNDGDLVDAWGNQSTEKDATDVGGLGHQSTAKDSWSTDGWERAVNNRKTSSSPGPEARRQSGRSNSPRSGWKRSHRSRSRSRSGSRSRTRTRTRSRSRSRTRSRSRSRSRSRTRSWSRSPSHGFRRDPQRWTDRGRIGAGGPPCRDFAEGRCRRGSQCKFSHEDGGRKHFESGRRDTRDSRYDRGRYSGHDNKGSFTESREQRDYSRDRPSQGHWEKPDMNRSNKSTERCFDFTRGRCQRGSACRYIHHDASSDGGWHMKDEAREISRDRRDVDTSFGRRLERVPCRYFPEGNCRHGENCKFSHQATPHRSLDRRSQDDKLDYSVETGYSSSRTSHNLSDQTAAMDQTDSSPWMTDKNSSRVSVAQSNFSEGKGHSSQHLQPQNPQENIHHTDAPQNTLSSQEQNKTHQVSGQYPHVPAVNMQVMGENTNTQQHLGGRGGNIVANSIISPARVNSVNKPFTLAVPGQNFIQAGPNQCVIGQPLHMQNFAPNGQLQQIVPPQPFNGQMHQVYPVTSNGPTQFVSPRGPPNNHIFNPSLQSQTVATPPHNVQGLPSFNLGGQFQQNSLRNGPNQQKYNVSGQSQGLSVPPIVQNQPNHQPQQFPPYNGQNQQNINITGQGQPIHLPQAGLAQQVVHSVAPSAQNHYVTPQPVPNPQSFSGAQGHQIIVQHPQQAAANELIQNPGITVSKPSHVSAEVPITSKVVTTEQAAQITNLSASLAQFFGAAPQLPQLYATLNPESAAGQPPLQPLPNPSDVIPLTSTAARQVPIPDGAGPGMSDASNIPPGFSLATAVEKTTKLEEPQTIAKSSTTFQAIDGNQVSDEPNQIEVELSAATSSKEVNASETGQDNKGQTEHSEEADAEVRTDEESKKGKDSKTTRMFKCALVEFVKNTLKPAWKEGHLSKEVHKTIVKKVVDKVTTTMPSANIPQTQEKIDIYLAYSKEKLAKLVQAYMEKYV